MKNVKQIFKQGSITFYNSSIFFPEEVREDIMILYAYVRIADEIVDGENPQHQDMKLFIQKTEEVLKGGLSGDKIIDSFIDLAKRKKIHKKWIGAFLKSMKSDFTLTHYSTYDELQTYMYGSAEVIGLMMAKILNLPKQSYPYAQLQGEAFQLINFIRDIGDDLSRGRVYMPQYDLKKFAVDTLPPSQSSEKNFVRFLRFEIDRFHGIQKRAYKGYIYIPKKYRIPVKTASDMFIWTADQIYKDPLIVFKKPIKPTAHQVQWQFMKNLQSIL